MKRRGHDAGEENSDEDRCLHHPRMVRAADQECMAHWDHGFVSVEGVVRHLVGFSGRVVAVEDDANVAAHIALRRRSRADLVRPPQCP